MCLGNSERLPEKIVRPPDSNSTPVHIDNISNVGGCSVIITIFPLLHHCRRYSTRKNVSNISILVVIWSNINTVGSVNNWQATHKRCFSDCVRRDMFDVRTAVRPKSSIRIFIWKIVEIGQILKVLLYGKKVTANIYMLFGIH